jgi:hypothetical protein
MTVWLRGGGWNAKVTKGREKRERGVGTRKRRKVAKNAKGVDPFRDFRVFSRFSRSRRWLYDTQQMPGMIRVGAKRRCGLPASHEGLLRPYEVINVREIRVIRGKDCSASFRRFRVISRLSCFGRSASTPLRTAGGIRVGAKRGCGLPGWTRVGAKRRCGLPASREGLLRPYEEV